MTNKEILKLAIKVGFSLDEDDGTWFCFEEELLKFALAIHENGYNKQSLYGCLNRGPIGRKPDSA